LSVDHIKSTFNALRRNKETGAIIWEEQVLLKVPDMVKKEQKTVELEHLIEISRYYGNDPDFVIAGGGNTSYKDDTRIWIKASGIPLAGISEKEFVCLSREKLGRIGSALYNEDPFTREQEVKRDLNEAIISPQNLRPSVETSLHNLIGYSYVVHTHPTLVNGLMCSNRARDEVEARFGAEALYVEYTDPGFSLFKKVQERIAIYQGQHGTVPRIIFLQNHGVFVGADTIAEIRSLYESIDRKIHHGGEISWPLCNPEPFESETTRAIGNHFLERGMASRSIRCELVDHFTESLDRYLSVSRPLAPDIIVYCKSNYLFLGRGLDPDLAIAACEKFEATHGHYPKVILEEHGGLIAVEENPRSVENIINVFTGMMKISYLAENFGGPHFLTAGQVRFIDDWEVENYRREVARGTGS
jgi:rhamnose utilization protein RhaD (predicted bifunctional aldolase and dehydrogenase)